MRGKANAAAFGVEGGLRADARVRHRNSDNPDLPASAERSAATCRWRKLTAAVVSATLLGTGGPSHPACLCYASAVSSSPKTSSPNEPKYVHQSGDSVRSGTPMKRSRNVAALRNGAPFVLHASDFDTARCRYPGRTISERAHRHRRPTRAPRCQARAPVRPARWRVVASSDEQKFGRGEVFWSTHSRSIATSTDGIGTLRGPVFGRPAHRRRCQLR